MNFSVALCFWGLTRSLRYTLPSIQEQIFKPLEADNITYHVYLHTYAINTTYTNERSGEINMHLNNTEYLALNPLVGHVTELTEADRVIDLERYTKWEDPWTNNYASLRNFVRALYSMFNVSTAVQTSEHKYDAVVFLRPDVRYLNPINTTLLRSLEPDTAYLPDFHTNLGANDRFALGTPGVMRIFGSRFLLAELYAQRNPPAGLHAERFALWMLNVLGIKQVQIPFRFQRVRATGQTYILDKPILPDGPPIVIGR